MRRALDIDEASYGPDHPKVALRLGNLGSILHLKGESAEGKAFLERALRIFEASFAPDHPYVLMTKRQLAAMEGGQE